MTRQTRQPEMLRELFDALGNDPRLIAETLVRPVLADRLVRARYAEDRLKIGTAVWPNASFESWWANRRQAASTDVEEPSFSFHGSSLLTAGCENDTWRPIGLVVPVGARDQHLLWTGTEVWPDFDLIWRVTPSTRPSPQDRYAHLHASRTRRRSSGDRRRRAAGSPSFCSRRTPPGSRPCTCRTISCSTPSGFRPAHPVWPRSTPGFTSRTCKSRAGPRRPGSPPPSRTCGRPCSAHTERSFAARRSWNRRFRAGCAGLLPSARRR